MPYHKSTLSMSKFLLVDDDVGLCNQLREWFRDKAIDLEIVGSGGDALQMLKSYSYEMIFLDWHLPDMTGLTVCQKYRATGGKTHIIFLTGAGDIECKEAALLGGGDDYLVKPFDLRELYARVRSVLRRPLESVTEVVEIAGLVLDVQERTATVGDKQVRLTPREAGILEYLIKHAGRPFSASRLLSSVWPSDTDASDGTVRTCVLNLRKKLEILGKGDLIKLVVNSGYVIEKK
jgi:DNA-binding response OmpR family regulator